MNEQYNFTLGLNSNQSTTTKKDIFGEPPPDYVPGKGRGAVGFASGVSRDDSSIAIDLDIGDYSDTRFDKFAGFKEVLFKDIKYDEEDKQADSVYEMIEEKLSTRRKVQKERKLREEIMKTREHRPTIQQQFSDLKRSLGDVRLEEWDRIPELGDYSLKNKKVKHYTPIPDNLICSNNNDAFGSLLNNCEDSTDKTNKILQNDDPLNELGTAKGNVLSLKLNEAMDSVSGQTVIDSSSYLNSLNSVDVKFNSDISDIKKARLLLKSVVNTNPRHAPAWIAAARFEEVVGKISQAREILAQGCEMCPKNEDIWFEAIRIGKTEDVNKIIAKAIKCIPNSAKIWLEAANRETNKHRKLLIIKKALEFIPNSTKLWKEAILLVDPESEKLLLTKAVSCVPQSEELWLKLASISDYNDSQKVLNEARKELPTNPNIWVAAAKLEESNKKIEKVDLIIKRCISSLSANRFVHSRSEWLEKAGQCEKDGFPITCSSIIKNTLFFNLNDDSMKHEIFSDIENFIKKQCILSARAVFEKSSEKLKLKKSFWIKWSSFEEEYGNNEKVDSVLQESLKHCSNKEILWLKAANNQCKNGNIELARFILSKGYSSVNDKEKIILAAVNLEKSQGEIERARVLLERERSNFPTVNIWAESIQLERRQKQYERCLLYCSESVKKFPNSPIFWFLYVNVHKEVYPGKKNDTLGILENGLRNCSDSVDLWLLAVDLLISEKNWKKARTFMELARSKNKNKPELWVQTIQLERSAGNTSFIPQLISRALKECPKSGLIHAESIFLEPKVRQKSKAIYALELCENDPYVLTTIAILFWKENDFFKARKWFGKSIEADPEIGDSWLHYLAFEILNGDEASQLKAIKDFLAANPNKGFEWNKIRRTFCSWDLSPSEILIDCLNSKYGTSYLNGFSIEAKKLMGLI